MPLNPQLYCPADPAGYWTSPDFGSHPTRSHTVTEIRHVECCCRSISGTWNAAAQHAPPAGEPTGHAHCLHPCQAQAVCSHGELPRTALARHPPNGSAAVPASQAPGLPAHVP
eukprot:364262-Chlamydomonas_euryale.AAC.12